MPLKELLSHVQTTLHPLNQYILKPESLKKVIIKQVDPSSVRVLTLNTCLVPYCFEPLIPAPY